MSVKSTINLTRGEAVRLCREMLTRRLVFAAQMTDKELEDELEALDDEEHGGESFKQLPDCRLTHNRA